MLWTPLSQRLHHVPLILAGPILRRTDTQAVTVWLALKEAKTVTLKIYATVEGRGEVVGELVMSGSRSTVSLGKYLHIVAVTAQPLTIKSLAAGKIYAYHLEFESLDCSEIGLLEALGVGESISYFSHQYPTFTLPPTHLNDLRIIHGSCRKPHGQGQDALPILDELIALHAKQPKARPHQLFLTGDQIYGDDVADPLLWAVSEAGDTLLGWEEALPMARLELLRAEGFPIPQSDLQKLRTQKPATLKPGRRTDIAQEYGGFTAMLVNKPEKAKSHLFSLGEYFAIYLFVWSPALWGSQFPSSREMGLKGNEAKQWDAEAKILQQFAQDLPKVRRILANIPTYTICDDHDVSDDWYLNREWCHRVLGKPLGRRVVQNALLAYAIFQAWGNTPEQFELGTGGATLLELAQEWSQSEGQNTTAWEVAGKYLGMPLIDQKTGLPQFQSDENVWILDREYPDGIKPLNWHYTVRSFQHEVLVLDTRTWRGYPYETPIEPPMLLCHKGFKDQIQIAGDVNLEATLVVIPTNLVSLKIIDRIQQWDIKQGRVFNSDAGDAWNFHEVALVKLLEELFTRRQRVIILTGDIHYSAAVRLSYWSRHESKSSILAQLTASAFKNQEWTTQLIHTKLKSLIPEPVQLWVGWQHPLELVKLEEGRGKQALKGMLQSKSSLPDLEYRVEWIPRQKSRPLIIDGSLKTSKQPAGFSFRLFVKKIWEMLLGLWQNRWIQEGPEVVGVSNFGLVSFEWGSETEEKAVIQDVYWRPGWDQKGIVYSRYWVSLECEQEPPTPQ